MIDGEVETWLGVVARRLTLAVLGAVAALALWALGDNWRYSSGAPMLYLALFTFTAVQSLVALALAGPLSVTRALAGALLLSVPLTGLVGLAGLRYGNPLEILDDSVMLAVVGVLLLFATPFLAVALQDRKRWAKYALLFDTAWTMVLRYGLALVFVGVFWLIVFLSTSLLRLVDITLVERWTSSVAVRFAVSGWVLGLGLAVMHELRAIVSPHLGLRLLRLLVPIMLVVVALFLTALPLRGLSYLFGEFSSAGTLIATAILAITLVSAALERDDAAAVQHRGLRAATRALALLVPLLAALAVWAVLLRVRQYGWTPHRALAVCVAWFLLAYGVGYGAAVIGRWGWAGRIRSVNVIMALAVVAIAALWMTPVLDVYRLSTNSQVARFQQGDAHLDQLSLWQLEHDWGRAGQAGLRRLEAFDAHPEHDELIARIKTLRRQATPFQFEQAILNRAAPESAAKLARLLAVRPGKDRLDPDLLLDLSPWRMAQWLEGCARKLPDGQAACVMVRGAFLPSQPEDGQGIVLYLDAAGAVQADFVVLSEAETATFRVLHDLHREAWPILDHSALTAALSGDFTIRPTGGNALFLDGAVLAPGY
ncbi:DUF4153 domain-containing protein [Pontibaca salina]|uniref:DUF4153 domain-containing protein n=1 Tax=Pontibaca salina TaxID=2795731 RepID=A0A934HSE6_9RHOB|nr:DUF4153 domain-containing protein [Pontibaca salina]MBI6630006.1 DUF4153 domain-containing protein [Pontibaca salina]